MTDDMMIDRNQWKVTPQAKWSGGAIAIFSTSLSTAGISSQLGLEPTWPDSPRPNRSEFDDLSMLNGENVAWVMESGLPRSSPLEDHIHALLEVVEPRAEAFNQLSQQALIELRLCFASEWGQGGFSLDHSTVQRLAALPFDMTIELTYPPLTSRL